MDKLKVDEVAGGVEFRVKVVPGSSRNAAAGVLGDALKVKIAAPAESGKANRALEKFLAELLGIKSKAVSIVSGLHSPSKVIRAEGVSADKVQQLG